jgi:adenine-specific DNA-methyltransferase
MSPRALVASVGLTTQDVLDICAINKHVHSAESDKLGHIPVLKAPMNPHLHTGADLKATGANDLFATFIASATGA